MRRVRDLVLLLVGLVIASPLMVLCALMILAESRGPVLFRQIRVGKSGKCFRIHKFRTMKTGAPGLLVTAGSDARITRVGRLLRRWKLDELPQLVDVLVGSMSLVGPRPEVPAFVELWPEEERKEILSVRPGLTDPMTVLLRDEERLLANAIDPQREYVENLLPRKVRGYVSYVRHRSFWGDAMILISTLRTIIGPAATKDGLGSFTDSEVV